MASGIDGRRERWTRNRRGLNVGFVNTFKAWPSCDIALQKGHATGALVIIVEERLLFLELFFKLPLSAYDIQSNARLEEGVSPDRLATMFAYSMTGSTLSIDACNREVRY